jgi:hypothetical protein
MDHSWAALQSLQPQTQPDPTFGTRSGRKWIQMIVNQQFFQIIPSMLYGVTQLTF